MNRQATRQGKLQIELDRAQLGTLIWALHRTAAVTIDARQRSEAVDMAAWLVKRGHRRWGHADRPQRTLRVAK